MKTVLLVGVPVAALLVAAVLGIFWLRGDFSGTNAATGPRSAEKKNLSSAEYKDVLTMSDRNPIVLLELRPGMSVEFSRGEYDENGVLKSYEAKITQDGRPRTVKVHQKGRAPKGQPTEFAADRDGKEIPLLKGDAGKVLIGFELKDGGGAVLAYTGTIQLEMTSDFGYDESGRKFVEHQTITHEGKYYDVSYSGHICDKLGRLAGYKVLVNSVN